MTTERALRVAVEALERVATRLDQWFSNPFVKEVTNEIRTTLDEIKKLSGDKEQR